MRSGSFAREDGEYVVVDAVGGPSPGERARPRRVASFEIEEEIGRGGMGIVYRARDLKLEREVALKRPREDAATRPGFLKRFMTEARMASQLMHPHITTVFEVFEEDAVPWMVMELIDGESLRSMLSDATPLPFEDVLRHAEGLTDALRVAHVGGVLHRDINPNNILLGIDGRARLSDFGLARAWEEPGSEPENSKDTTQSIRSESVAGTRGYVSPEQVLGKLADPRSDIFSLGAVLYEMCTGRAAFPNRDPGVWMDNLLHSEPEPISEVNSRIPVEFESIVRKAVAKRPFQRYQSANEMLLDVRALQRRLQSDSDHSWPDVPPPNIPRRGWFVVAGIAIAALAATVVLMVVFPPADKHSAADWRHHQLTTASGWEGEPALSPNGEYVAYVSDQSGNQDIFIAHISGEDPLQITKHPAADSDPAWFPDGGALAFVSDRDGSRSVWRVPHLGGSPLLLAPLAEEPAISPDGSRIVFTRPDSSGLRRIWVAPLDEPDRARQLTDADHGLWAHMGPTWSSDGRTLCYSDWRNLWLLPLDGAPPRPLTTADAVDREPAWAADGGHIYFSSYRSGEQALWRIRPNGSELEFLTSGASQDGHPSVSPDGMRIAYATSRDNADIIILDRRTGERAKLGGARGEQGPALAPDGSSIVFHSDRTGASALWYQALENGHPAGDARRLTSHPGTVAVPDYSPDSRWIAYQRVLDGQRDIWIIPAGGGVSTRFTDDSAIDIHPDFSPDGSRLAFSSFRSGDANIWVAPVEDGRRVGEPQRITSGEGAYFYPAWSPDGTRIAYVFSGGFDSDVAIVDIDSQTAPVQVTRGAGAQRVQWAASGDSLLVAGTWGTDSMRLRTVSLEEGISQPLEPPVILGPEGSDAGMFNTAMDGQLLAYVSIERSGDVWLAERGGQSD